MFSGRDEKSRSTEDKTLLKDSLVERGRILLLDLGYFLQTSSALDFLLSQAGEERKEWGQEDDSPGRELYGLGWNCLPLLHPNSTLSSMA